MESQTEVTVREQEQGKPPELLQNITAEQVEQWLQMSRSEQDTQVALEYSQRAVDLNPDDPRVQESVQRAVCERLSQDAFVAFLAETDKSYVITFRDSRPVVVPKARAQPEIYPPPERTEGENVLGMVWWMLVGLLLAGLGALVLSPIVVRRALDMLNRRDTDARERRLALLAAFLSTGLGLLGGLFTLLLLLHLFG